MGMMAETRMEILKVLEFIDGFKCTNEFGHALVHDDPLVCLVLMGISCPHLFVILSDRGQERSDGPAESKNEILLVLQYLFLVPSIHVFSSSIPQ